MTNAELYGNFRKIIQKIRERRTRFAGHCCRSEKSVSKMILWASKHGNKRPGRPDLTSGWPWVTPAWPWPQQCVIFWSGVLLTNFSGHGYSYTSNLTSGWPWMTPEWLSTEYQPHFWKFISLMHSQAFRWCLWVIDFMVTLLRKPNMKRFVVGGF